MIPANNNVLSIDTNTNQLAFNGTIYARNIVGDTAAGGTSTLSNRSITPTSGSQTVVNFTIDAQPYARTVFIPCPWFASDDGNVAEVTVQYRTKWFSFLY